ncbi:hypothetical protein DESUT3_20980 [Desulfuromonas versatilis]|uniref:Uncharacterized protein n=1 Tax=Desulfuromonas versatilis TaxID=2802975 RepID=A0ABN6E0M9_9BACT|nr:hypothetical protein DESUT3_20980 [Desulfuromonas versatilis]
MQGSRNLCDGQVLGAGRAGGDREKGGQGQGKYRFQHGLLSIIPPARPGKKAAAPAGAGLTDRAVRGIKEDP